MLEGAVGPSVTQRLAQVAGGVALSQQQDPPRVVAGEPRGSRAQRGEVSLRRLAHLGECHPQLVDVGASLSRPPWVVSLAPHVLTGAARRELVAGHAAQIGGVHEQLP